MSDARIFVSRDGGDCVVKVVGRATFVVCPTLRDLVRPFEVDPAAFEGDVVIDLTECSGMDSTFMGILAMFALKARKAGKVIKILNASVSNRRLLDGLGLGGLFDFVDGTPVEADGELDEASSESSSSSTAETVLDAHKTLMEADEGNVEKFKKVVEMVEKEVKDK
jgi:anti-anti-sigma regulatory factor